MKSSNDRPDLGQWDSNSILEGELYDFVEDSLNTINLYNDPAYSKAKSHLLVTAQGWWYDQYHHIKGQLTHANFSGPAKELLMNSVIEDYLFIPDAMGSVNVSVYDLQGRLVAEKSNQRGKVYLGNLQHGRYILLFNREELIKKVSAMVIKN